MRTSTKPLQTRTNLKLLRVKHHLTQEQMAERIGCTRVNYSTIESGVRNGRDYFWMCLQKAFDIPDEDMWKLKKKDQA